MLSKRKKIMYSFNTRVAVLCTATFFVLSVLVGCNAIGRVMYGVKKPKVESKESILSFLEKKKLSTENVFCVDMADFKPTLLLTKNKIPDVLIFNKKGEYLPYGEEWACNASAFDFIENLNDTTVYKTTDLTTLDNLLGKFKDLGGLELTTETLSKLKSNNFVVVAFWTKWSGKLNKTKVKEWETQAKNNTKTSITFVKLNLDMQDWWEANKKESK